MAKTIMVVDDEVRLVALLESYLTQEGYQVVTAYDGDQALNVAHHNSPDLIILDLMMPKVDGLEFMRRHRAERNTPIILLTAQVGDEDKVLGLELGADDYVTKPFSPRVLVSRIRAVLRRRDKTPANENVPLRYDEMEIDPRRFKVFVKGSLVELTHTEFSILHFLAKKPGWVFTRYQIIDAIKGLDYPVTDRSVDVQVVGLRKKLGEYGDYIETVRGVGYRFREL